MPSHARACFKGSRISDEYRPHDRFCTPHSLGFVVASFLVNDENGLFRIIEGSKWMDRSKHSLPAYGREPIAGSKYMF